MKNFLYLTQWNWKVSGIAIGMVFLIAVVFAKPIGVSTQFVILDGIVWDSLSDTVVVDDANTPSGYSSTNPYLNKSGGKYANNIADPVNYGLIFVLAMIPGGILAARLQTTRPNEKELIAPEVWRCKFGNSSGKRYLAAFAGGALTLFGARLAGGCTSGHMMSGIMQTSLSGYLFTISTFALAVPVAIFFFKADN